MYLYHNLLIINLLFQLVNKQMTYVYGIVTMKHVDHSYWQPQLYNGMRLETDGYIIIIDLTILLVELNYEYCLVEHFDIE